MPNEIALLQLASVRNDLQANLVKGEAVCRRAKTLGADIALFPEMWSAGYQAAVTLDPYPSELWRAPHLWTDGSAPEVTPEQLASIWVGLAISPRCAIRSSGISAIWHASWIWRSR